MAVKDVQSKAELEKVVGEGSPVILHFWAGWCEASKQMDQVFSHLSTDFPHVHFLRVEAEEQPEISEDHSISAVPFFVFFKDGKRVDTLEGADPSSLAHKVGKVAGSMNSNEPAAPASLGLAAGPTILESVKQQYSAGSNGSSLVTAESVETGQDQEEDDNLNKRLQQLINSHPVMLFMKGSPEEPRCGFSRKLVEILNKEKVNFGSFDILSDQEVREGLKKFSSWPTYPQLYCKGELLGGSDIAIAMHESGELHGVFRDHGILEETTTTEEKEKEKEKERESESISIIKETGTSLEDRLKGLVHGSSVMLFMKGTPEAPRCGFSTKVVNALKEEGVSFGSFDILSDQEVREGLKTYSNWPTYPQLYYKGELVGGCDIVLELKSNGELKSTLSE
ncbi:Monothiol glutaredoxin-S17 [Dionaea muscipula]